MGKIIKALAIAPLVPVFVGAFYVWNNLTVEVNQTKAKTYLIAASASIFGSAIYIAKT
jgi:hypothetical protein